jgi:Fe2+ transport system protein FeoA
MHDSRRTTSLKNLKPGQAAELAGYGDLNSETIERFKALGFTEGRTVYCIRKAVFGCPIEFEVLGTRFAVRAEQANEIYGVEQTPSDNSV